MNLAGLLVNFAENGLPPWWSCNGLHPIDRGVPAASVLRVNRGDCRKGGPVQGAPHELVSP